MAKLTGSTNYKFTEVQRLLSLVAKFLPLGKDEWERLASMYNSNRGRGIGERDYESLRRKFKMLYSIRKPTGVADMPPHVKEAKQLKQSIDDKASVEEMDDGADVDDQQEEEGEQHPDFSFNFDGDDGIGNDSSSVSNTTDSARGSLSNTDTPHREGSSSLPSLPNEPGINITDAASSFAEILESAAVHDGLEAFASTPRSSSGPDRSTQRELRSAGLPKPSQSQNTTSTAVLEEQSSADRSRRAAESTRYLSYSNRLGGGNLAEFRGTIGRKRDADDDQDLHEASYAKVKRAKAIKAATQLKKRLGDLESSSGAMGTNIVELMILMREDSERRGEARRAEEEQRRRDEVMAREARYRAEKLEAEERRRQEKLETEERARRDKEEARAHSQELMFFISALVKKE